MKETKKPKKIWVDGDDNVFPSKAAAIAFAKELLAKGDNNGDINIYELVAVVTDIPLVIDI